MLAVILVNGSNLPCMGETTLAALSNLTLIANYVNTILHENVLSIVSQLHSEGRFGNPS